MDVPEPVPDGRGRPRDFDVYVWKAPRDLQAGDAVALLDGWHVRGADPATSPFEPSVDVGWFHREEALRAADP